MQGAFAGTQAVNIPEPSPIDEPVKTSHLQKIVTFAVALCSLFYTFITLVEGPGNVSPTSLDDSWKSVLHVAFLRHAVWGRDVVFTYGPWGFLFCGTRHETLALWLACRLFLTAVCWWALWRLGEATLPRPILRAAWVCICVSVISIAGTDLQIMVVPFLLLLIASQNERRDRLLLAALCMAAGLCAWVKHSAAVMGFIVVGAITINDLIARRRPFCLLCYLFSVFGSFLAARQPLGALPDYVRNHWEILIGYGPAMAQSTPTADRMMLLYVLLSFVILAIVALQHLKKPSAAIVTGAAVAAWLIVIFKESFVRQDSSHIELAGPSLLLAIFLLSTDLSAFRKTCLALAATGVVLATLICNAPHRGIFAYPVKAISRLLRDTPYLVSRFSGYFADLYSARKPAQLVEEEFPPIDGPVDAVPWSGPYAFDQLHSRPVFQSYVAYTPRLAHLNAKFLQSDAAPPNLLWRVQSIDSHFASMEDPLIWPETLARYRYTGDVAGQLVLSRKEKGSYRLIPMKEMNATFGETVEVPPSDTGRIWLKMQLKPTATGMLRSLAYRPASLQFTTETAGGSHSTAKLIVPITACGFLLSPKIDDSLNFKNLIEGDPRGALAPLAVRRISVVPADPDAFVGYERKLVYQFFDLDTE